jgi:2-dehydro-3-deoxyphosphooctonate aldolase (KDO 8-P synthase)
MVNQIRLNINDITIGGPAPFVLIAGPCVIEDERSAYALAAFLKDVTGKLDIPFIFKASYDKANRTAITSFRGPGMEKGLKTLSFIREDLGIPVTSDVHRVSEVEAAAQVLDIIQIPAFLCRQTDLVVAAARTGKPVNIKKGQFLAPWDMKNAVEKALSTGNNRILLTERGAMFGYNSLVTDFRSIKIMQETGCPVIFDATHSVQMPGGAGSASSGERRFAPILARAAVAVGVDGVFIEVHENPDQALSDGPNAMKTEDMEGLLRQLKAIADALRLESQKTNDRG